MPSGELIVLAQASSAPGVAQLGGVGMALALATTAGCPRGRGGDEWLRGEGGNALLAVGDEAVEVAAVLALGMVAVPVATGAALGVTAAARAPWERSPSAAARASAARRPLSR